MFTQNAKLAGLKSFCLLLLYFLIDFSAGHAETAFESALGIQKSQEAIVQEVVSADTIVIESSFKNGEKVRLIGLKAPEPPEREETKERDEFGFVIPEKARPFTPIEEEALNFATKLLEGKKVRLEFDVSKKNDELVTTAYVFLLDDNTFANQEILRQGYAHLSIQPPNLKYAEKLKEAYKEARQEKRGLQGQ